jgi:hypothetical protein
MLSEQKKENIGRLIFGRREPILLLVLIILASFFSCKKSVGISDSEKSTALEARRALFAQKINTAYTLDGTFSTPEEAVEAFVNSLVNNGSLAAGSYLYSEKDYLEFYWPNESEDFNMIFAVPPEAAWKMQSAIRGAILPVLAGRFAKGQRYSVSELKIKKTEKRNSLTLLLPERILLRSGMHQVAVPEIRLIIEYKGRFKIASIWKEEE